MEGIELDKMGGYLKRGHNTPVKRIGTKKKHDPDRTKRWVEESNIRKPPELLNERNKG